MSDRDRIVHEVGGLILTNPNITSERWDSLAIVVTIKSGGGSSMHGYQYWDDDFEANIPKAPRNIIALLRELRTLMAAETGAEWHQCLIQIWKPGPKIHIDFEYDDPQRWKPRITGLDMSEYANSIRPPMGGATDGT